MRKPFLVPTPESKKKLNYQTGISLSLNHRVAIGKLQAKRMAEGKGKPTLRAILVEALELLLAKENVEGWWRKNGLDR